MLILTPRFVAALSKKRSLLDFNFIANQSLDPQISFSRTTIGTRFNSAGLLVTESPNVPRFDYDPATLDALGLLVEPQRTNLFLQSEAFDNSVWSKFNATVTANAATAPDGNVSADKIVENTVDGIHSVDEAAGPGPVASLSVFLKAAERTYATAYIRGPGIRATIHVDLTGAVVVGELYSMSTKISANATALGNSYVLATVSASSSGFNGAAIVLGDSAVLETNSGNAYLGDGVSGIYAWGAQLEAGAFPTSYIPTAASQFTRTADVPQVTLPQTADILVQDREGGAWITGIPAGPYTMAPRTDKRHIARWRAFPAGYAASHPELAVAYP